MSHRRLAPHMVTPKKVKNLAVIPTVQIGNIWVSVEVAEVKGKKKEEI